MESKPLTPKLRFPEFQQAGNWEEVQLNRFASFVNDRVGDADCVPYTVTSGVGLVSQVKKFGRTIAGNSLSSYVRLVPNDFAYNKSSTKSYPEGYIARFRDDVKAAVPKSIFTCFRVDFSKAEPAYLDYLFASNLHGRWLRNFLTVGARAHGSLNVNDSDLMALPVPLPAGEHSRTEQQKIAECLTSLDELIAAEGQKLDALRTYKKGLMQNLFPREGETTPRLRFPEFRDAGEWCESTVGEQAVLLSGFPFDGKEILENSKGVPLMRGINITEGMVRHNPEIDRYFLGRTDKLEKYVLRESDLVIGMDGSKVGKNSALISKRDVGALLVQRVARLRTEDPTTNMFIFQIINSPRFHSYVDRINTSSGIPHISAKQINDFQINLPREAEQGKIADLLTSINALITAQAKKLDALKLHKQGLMQGLFPVLDEVAT